MKMTEYSLKGLTTVLIGWLTWINQTFTPLFWVLIALITLDLLLGAHKEGQQFGKIGSMAISLGIPSYIASNLSNPNVGKYIVAMLCIVYLQVVVPQIIAKLQSLKLSNDPTQNKLDQAEIEALIKRAEDAATAKAQEVARAAQSVPMAPTIIQDEAPKK